MQTYRAVFLTAILSSLPAPAFGDGIGTPVTGALFFTGVSTTNYFDPIPGAVPTGQGYGNETGTTVLIGSNIEFGSGYPGEVREYTADFTGSTVVLGEDTRGGSIAATYVFTDPAFTGFTLISESVPVTYSFLGDTLSVSIPQTTRAQEPVAIAFSYTTSTLTPEPGSLILVGTGALGALGAICRRRRLTRIFNKQLTGGTPDIWSERVRGRV